MDGKVKLGDFPSCKLKGKFSGFKSYPIDLCFSADGRLFLSLDGEGGLRQWDTGTGKLVRG